MHPNDSPSLPERIARHLAPVPRSGIRDFFDVVSTMSGVVSLGIGEPDFDTPWHVREAAVFALERGATHYTSNLGLPALRREVSAYLDRAFGVRYDPDNEILITVGVSEAMDLAVRALVNPGDGVLYHEPCYVSYNPLIRFAHGMPQAVPTGPETGFRVTREALERAVTPGTRVLVLNLPNNPTGAVARAEELDEIAAFARERDLLVLSDEIYAELTYEGRHASFAALPGMKDRTILLHGLSKAWAMTGFRIGFACGPAPLIEAMMKIHQYTMLCAPVLSQEAAVEALRDSDDEVNAMRAQYRDRRNYLAQSLRELGFDCPTPGGAFYLFPRLPVTGMSSRDFALRLLREQKVAMVPGTAFGACGEGFVRCSYATSMDQIQEAVIRIRAFLGSL
jgi:aminotransferase